MAEQRAAIAAEERLQAEQALADALPKADLFGMSRGGFDADRLRAAIEEAARKGVSAEKIEAAERALAAQREGAQAGLHALTARRA
eukprot:762099-Prymnesium_polylepis.1